MIPSELLEAPMQQAIGRCWRECDREGGLNSRKASEKLKAQLRALERFALCCKATRTQLVLGALQSKLARLITVAVEA